MGLIQGKLKRIQDQMSNDTTDVHIGIDGGLE